MLILPNNKYNNNELRRAKLAYDFILRIGDVSYKSAAEMVQRGSMAEIGFTRADLINAQEIYGTPSAYVLGHGTNSTPVMNTQQVVPTEQSRPQALHVDLYFLFGQVFFLSISFLMGLIIVTHLGHWYYLHLHRVTTREVKRSSNNFFPKVPMNNAPTR